MKKVIICLLAICTLLTLTACGGGKDVDLAALEGELTAIDAFTMEIGQFEIDPALASLTYGFDGDDVVSVSFYSNTGTAEEIFLAQAKDSAAAKNLEKLCKARVANQTTSLQSYIQDAIPRLQNAVLKRQGSYVALVVAENDAEVKAVVNKYFK